jgi:nicotinamide riboside transporter PnuC
MDFLKILEILYTLMIIVSVYLISIPKRIGLYIMVVGQFLAVPVFYSRGLYFALVLMLILNVLNIKGIICWKKKGVGI